MPRYVVTIIKETPNRVGEWIISAPDEDQAEAIAEKRLAYGKNPKWLPSRAKVNCRVVDTSDAEQ